MHLVSFIIKKSIFAYNKISVKPLGMIILSQKFLIRAGLIYDKDTLSGSKTTGV
jgi:hypothetical protein